METVVYTGWNVHGLGRTACPDARSGVAHTGGGGNDLLYLSHSHSRHCRHRKTGWQYGFADHVHHIGQPVYGHSCALDDSCHPSAGRNTFHWQFSADYRQGVPTAFLSVYPGHVYAMGVPKAGGTDCKDKGYGLLSVDSGPCHCHVHYDKEPYAQSLSDIL